MTTARVVIPVSGTRGRLTRLRRSTPVALSAWTVALVVLITASAASMELSVSNRHSAVNSALFTSEPLLVRAVNVYTRLSDADTTAAGGFLSGAQQAAALRVRYNADLAQAAASLSAAGQEAGGNAQLSRAVQQLSVDLPIYSGLVETARANSLLGYPVGASYLGEASNLMRTQILPAASSLYLTERARLESDRHAATAKLDLIIGVVVLLTTIGTLVALQRWFGSRFRRILSPPLIAGLLFALIMGGWVLVSAFSQNSDANTAEHDGVAPLNVFTQARILGLQARADDELTLVTRDSVPAYQTDFTAVTGQLTRLLNTAPVGTDPALLADARRSLGQELSIHRQIRADDTSGNLTGAIARATGTSSQIDLPVVAEQLDASLSRGVTQSQGRFVDAMSSAGALNGLTIAIPILGLLSAALVILAVRPRLAEYR
jgi:hypothetical protein